MIFLNRKKIRNRFNGYIYSSFSQLFFPIFIVLFFISSVVLLINIANVTFVIKINALDLLQMFSYLLPTTLFFIIPMTFFISAVLSLSRLSFDYELLVFFSLGIRPFDIVKSFIPITILVGLTMLVFSIAIVPLSDSGYRNFISEKKREVDVNIRSGDLGQKAGDWLIYVEKSNKNSYEGLVLYSEKNIGYESFILSNMGNINNNSGTLELNLLDGEVYFADHLDIKKMIFEKMTIRSDTGEIQLRSYDLYEHWKDAFNGDKTKMRLFVQGILIAIFPIISIFLIPLFGIANPRFQKNLSYLYILLCLGLFYALIYLSSNYFPLLGLVLIPILWMSGSYMLYKKFILKYYWFLVPFLRKIVCKIAYDGSRFSGFSRQKSKKGVANALENGLRGIGIFSKAIGSGRTDKGVHASGQVIAFDVPSNIPTTKIKDELNKKLYPHIKIVSTREVDGGFNPRFDAKKRLYRYIIKEESTSPFEAPYLSYEKIGSISKIAESAKLFLGRHDFSMFKKSGGSNQNIKDIYRFDFYKHKNLYIFAIEADGFLRSQIRLMVGAILAYSRDELTLNQIIKQIECRSSHYRFPISPNDLYLARIYY